MIGSLMKCLSFRKYALAVEFEEFLRMMVGALGCTRRAGIWDGSAGAEPQSAGPIVSNSEHLVSSDCRHSQDGKMRSSEPSAKRFSRLARSL